ncbi:hypothetical protein R3P38DRAFT_1358544 [Favolaschia claudopus]|uniref:Uncharacterized protein n=1 Tax=Favolaschia claudopus TaxID=2862362 RepID=A0AAW0DVP5_9AGAR
MVSFLERIPHDVLLDIALAGALPGYAPPNHLLALLATSRTIYNGLHIHSSPHLHAAIFTLKYGGTIASRQRTASSLAAELVLRCRALNRCRRLDLSSPGLHQDLWTLLWMTVEEGRCLALTEARFPQFVVELAQCYLRDDMMPPGNIKTVIIWLLCLGLSRQDILVETAEVRALLGALLRPFVCASSDAGASPFSSRSLSPAVSLSQTAAREDVYAVPSSHVGSQDPEFEDDTPVEHYGAHIYPPHLPSPSDAAIILIFALKEAVSLQIPHHLPATRAIAAAENRSGPTAEDYTAFQRAITPLFTDVQTTMAAACNSAATTLKCWDADPWISEILAVPECSAERGLHSSMPLAGALTGIWEGSMMISSVQLGDQTPAMPSSPDFLCRTPMQCEFSEYYCLRPQGYIPDCSDTLLYNFDIGRDQHTLFQKLTPDNLPTDSIGTFEHVLVGQTLREHEEAWGPSGFSFAGRVYDNELIVFKRRPVRCSSSSSQRLS